MVFIYLPSTLNPTSVPLSWHIFCALSILIAPNMPSQENLHLEYVWDNIAPIAKLDGVGPIDNRPSTD